MIAKIWNHSEWLKMTNPEQIKQYFTDVLKIAGFNILNIAEHHFQPEGWTGLWLLSESHFAVHTFPEIGQCYIELSSCNQEYFVEFIKVIQNM